MQEVTVEVLNTMEEIDQILKTKGYKIVDDYMMNDAYYSKLSTDELLEKSYGEILANSFIVREVVEDGRYNLHLCYKAKLLIAMAML